jgi:hypothetical protein
MVPIRLSFCYLTSYWKRHVVCGKKNLQAASTLKLNVTFLTSFPVSPDVTCSTCPSMIRHPSTLLVSTLRLIDLPQKPEKATIRKPQLRHKKTTIKTLYKN